MPYANKGFPDPKPRKKKPESSALWPSRRLLDGWSTSIRQRLAQPSYGTSDNR